MTRSEATGPYGHGTGTGATTPDRGGASPHGHGGGTDTAAPGRTHDAVRNGATPGPADSTADATAQRNSGPISSGSRALVVTASNRAAAGVYADRGGPLIAERLTDWGFTVDGPRIVSDGDPVEKALRDGVSSGYDVILTTGGTGISPTDRTPEATGRVIDHEVPGIAEAIRAFGREKVATAVLSRGLAGVAGRTLIVNLPGSTGGVRDGLAVLEKLLPHAVDQLRGGDHPGSGGGAN